MQQQVKQIALSIATVCFLFSCNKKDDKPANPSPSVTDTVTSGSIIGTWKIANIQADKEFDDLWSMSDSCLKDDIVTFKSGNEVVYDEGVLKCDDKDPQTTTGSYSYTRPTLIINGSTLPVIQLDETTLRYTLPGISSNTGAEIILTYTYKRQ